MWEEVESVIYIMIRVAERNCWSAVEVEVKEEGESWAEL
jgi:hypothetical protein